MAESSTAADGSAFRSVHTSELPRILRDAGVSLAVSTYQSNRLILVRQSDPGEPGDLNTRFCAFDKPMGICARERRLAVGTRQSICTYLNVPGLLARLPAGEEVHDSCYVPRGVVFTGNIDIHEMEWDESGELWFVNTRFSCLCTATADASFVPRWRPGFVSSLAPEDRCHLNGMAMRDGQPRYVTALGMSDLPNGWRPGKTSGGVLLDVTRDRPLAEGLSMPHSPRWYANRLWFLESGRGALCYLDDDGGTVTDVAVLPGFVRGLDFAGAIAFIGLSKVRETATFSGLPLNRQAAQRTCGVWAVNIHSGQVLGFLRFEEDVEEIFSVTVLQGTLAPELLPADSPYLADTYVLPDGALKEVSLTDEQTSNRLPAAAFSRGREMLAQGRPMEAVEELRRCLQMEENFPHARLTLGVALAEAGRLDEALTELAAAAEREPDRADVHVSLGTVHQRLGEPLQAQQAFEEAIQRDSHDAVAHACLGHLLLRLGDYRRGFTEYRWRTPAMPASPSAPPIWNGDPAPHASLLLLVDHRDLNSTLVLMRLVPLAAERLGSLVVAGPEPWLPLLAQLPGISVRAIREVQRADYDLECTLDGLPLALGLDQAHKIPCPPYLDVSALLRQNPGSSTEDRCSLAVGLALQESPLAQAASPGRSHILQELAPQLTADGLSIHALSQADAVAARECGLCLHDSPAPDDLVGLAASIHALDLVIGHDGPAIHVAGALGKPAWAVLGRTPGWWWPFDGRQSTWFPATRIVDPAGSLAWSELKSVIGALSEPGPQRSR